MQHTQLQVNMIAVKEIAEANEGRDQAGEMIF